MKTALNSTSSVNNFINKSQRVLLILSNTDFLLEKVFPQIIGILEGLFSSELPTQACEAINVAFI